MTQPYNILFIVTDQEYAHQPLPDGFRLPNREWLKARGVTFENYQVTTTLCTPSRACMYTGQHTPLTGMWDNDNMSYISNLSTEIPTMGHMLREAGYYTAYLGKWHLSRQAYDHSTSDELEPYGFADFQTWGNTFGRAAEGEKVDPRIASDAAEWLRQKSGQIAQEQPWFLAVNFINPHDIMFFHMGEGHEQGNLRMAPAPDTELYRQQWDVQLPVSFDDDFAQQPQGVRNYKAFNHGLQGRTPHERRDLWKNHINYYLNCHLDVDQHLGTLFSALEATGQLENTIIVFTSDHGEMGGAHGLREKGFVLFKELVNTPLIVMHPQGEDNASTTAVASALDLVPTMLSWAGVSADRRVERHPQLKGHDLTPVILDTKNAGVRGNATQRGGGVLYTFDCLFTYDFGWFAQHMSRLLDDAPDMNVSTESADYIYDPTAIFTELDPPNFNRRNIVRGTFDGRYKLVRYFALNNYHLPATVDDLLTHNDVALYDLQNDPHEMVNLANPAHPDYNETLLAEMNAKLNALILAEIGEDKNKVGL